MTEAGSWAARLLEEAPRQPDLRSCGAASLVMARALQDEGYAELLVGGTHPVTGRTLAGAPADRFSAETLAMHRRITGPVDVLGRLQLPWPRELGTPPWAAARQLAARRRPYAVHAGLIGGSRLADRVRRSLDQGAPAALYVGTRALPRHVVLAYALRDDRVAVFDPARGGTVLVDLAQRPLPFGRWQRLWFAVTQR